MKKTLLYATAVAFALSLGGGLVSSPAYAASDKDKAALAECKKLADPKAKDECVKKVNDKIAKEKKDMKAKADKKDKKEKKEKPKK